MEVLECLEANSHSSKNIKSKQADTSVQIKFCEAMIALKCIIYKAFNELGLTVLPEGLNPMSWN